MTSRDNHRAVQDEHGSVSIQLAVLMPVLFGVAFTGLQAGLYFYGRSAALSAAITGARAAAAEHGTIAQCQHDAEAFLAGLGDVLSRSRVQCSRTATTVTVGVTGTALSVIPGWQPQVDQVAVEPVERITR